MSTITLPRGEGQNKQTISAVCRYMVKQGVGRRNIERVEWLLNYYYLHGARQFSKIDYNAGTVLAQYRDSRGKLNYRYEQCTRRYQDEMGRRVTMDVRPQVLREGNYSLDGLQKAATGQAALNVMLSDVDLESILYEVISLQLLYGTVGLACWAQASARLNRTQPVLEVVPPWELLPIPADPTTKSELLGVCRHRSVSLEWVKSKMKLTNMEGKIKTKKRKIGDPQSDLTEEDAPSTYGMVEEPSFGDGSGDGARLDKVSAADVEQEYTDLDEMWFYDEDRRVLKRYIVMVGGWVVRDDDFSESEEKPIVPVHVIRDIPCGGFYGKSTFSLMRPTNIEVEHLIKQVFENAQDLDQFGFLLLPNDAGINVRQLKAAGKPRYIQYEPNMAIPNSKPDVINPVNSGDWPGKVAMMGREIIDDMAGQSEVMKGEAPGRVDSAAAIGRLQEAANMPLNAPLQSTATAFSGCYMAMLGMARNQWTDTKMAQITMLDDNLAGVKVTTNGMLQLESSAIPYPTELQITIQSKRPQSTTQRKIELVDMLNLGILDPMWFRITVRKEGIDLPVGNEAEWQNYRKAVLNNLILFGDGQEPGEIQVSEEADMPEVQLQVIQAFMAKPEFSLASKEVREKFERRKMFFQQQLGNLPEGMMNPEDEALLQQQVQEQAMGPAGYPGGPRSTFPG
jgi:hypothetical protein